MFGFEEIQDVFRRIPGRIRWLLRSDLVVTAVGAIFLAGGVYVRHSTKMGDFKEGLGALCDALVIAAFLRLAVDPIMKRELVKGAAQDVFYYAFGYSLPPELRSFVNDLVLKTKIVRRRCHLNWHIVPKDGDAKKVQVILDASFFIVNFSDEDLTYQHKVFSWKENVEDVGCVQAMFCECKNPRHKGYRNEKKEGLTPGNDNFIKGDEIALEHHTEEGEYRVGALYYAEAEWPGLDQFSIMEPTMEIDVTVTVDDSLGDLVFSVVPDLSEKKDSENYKYPERDKKSKRLQCTWDLNRVFVPNERILIRWKKGEIKPPEFRSVPS
jgi:hypothetical protein